MGQLCCPAPLALLSRTCTSPRCRARKQQDLLSAWTGPAGIGGLKRAIKQPLPTRVTQLSSCRNLHLSSVSSFPPPPLPFVLLHSRSLMAWNFFHFKSFPLCFSTSFLSPKIIQTCSSSLPRRAGTACPFPTIPSVGDQLVGPCSTGLNASMPLLLL